MAKSKPITDAQWAEARLLYSKGARMVDIADRSGIALRTIQHNKKLHPDLWVKDGALIQVYEDKASVARNSIPGLAEDLRHSLKHLTRELNKMMSNIDTAELEEVRKIKELATIAKTASDTLKNINSAEIESATKGVKRVETNIKVKQEKLDWNKLFEQAKKSENPDKFIETIVDAEFKVVDND